MPDISVVVAAHNGKEFVRETIESVLAQEHADFELVVIDDCSTDTTLEIANSYAMLDNRVRIRHHHNVQGIESSYRDGIESSYGSLVKVLDHDDTLPHSRVLAQQKALLDENPAMSFAGGRINYMDSSSNVYRTVGFGWMPATVDKRAALRQVILGARNYFLQGSLLFRKAAYEELGRGYDFWLVVKSLKSPDWDVGYVNSTVLNYRTHEGNNSRLLSQRLEAFSGKSSLALYLHDGNIAKAYAQQAYWALLEAAKFAYLQVRVNR